MEKQEKIVKDIIDQSGRLNIQLTGVSEEENVQKKRYQRNNMEKCTRTEGHQLLDK